MRRKSLYIFIGEDQESFYLTIYEWKQFQMILIWIILQNIMALIELECCKHKILAYLQMPRTVHQVRTLDSAQDPGVGKNTFVSLWP